MTPEYVLYIDNVPLGVREAIGLNQSYAEIEEGLSRRRMADGSLHLSCGFGPRLRTKISGEGHLSPGVGAISLRDGHIIRCVAPRALNSLSRIITIPAARRSDTPIEAAALIGEEWVLASHSLAGNTVTVAETAGAMAYRARYFPELTGYLVDRSEEADTWGVAWRWSLTFEEG